MRNSSNRTTVQKEPWSQRLACEMHMDVRMSRSRRGSPCITPSHADERAEGILKEHVARLQRHSLQSPALRQRAAPVADDIAGDGASECHIARMALEKGWSARRCAMGLFRSGAPWIFLLATQEGASSDPPRGMRPAGYDPARGREPNETLFSKTTG